MPHPEPPPDPFRQGLSFAARIGVELVVSTMVGTATGYFIDRWLDTGPIFLILGVVVGGAAGMLSVYRSATRSGS